MGFSLLHCLVHIGNAKSDMSWNSHRHFVAGLKITGSTDSHGFWVLTDGCGAPRSMSYEITDRPTASLLILAVSYFKLISSPGVGIVSSITCNVQALV